MKLRNFIPMGIALLSALILTGCPVGDGSNPLSIPVPATRQIGIRWTNVGGTEASADLGATSASGVQLNGNGELIAWGPLDTSGYPQNRINGATTIDEGHDPAANMLWARWHGTATVLATGNGADVHYIIADPLSGLPTSGGTTFVFAGGTTPTNYNGLQTGQFSIRSLYADYMARTVTFNNLQISLTNAVYTVNANAPLDSAGNFFIRDNNTQDVTCSGSACVNNVTIALDGHLEGNNAQAATLNYFLSGTSVDPNNSQNSISIDIVGVAGFK